VDRLGVDSALASLVERDSEQAWWSEIQKGIARANNFVVVLSPASMASPICQMEIEYARQLHKRIIPVLHADYDREACLVNITKRLAKKEETSTREIWGSHPRDLGQPPTA